MIALFSNPYPRAVRLVEALSLSPLPPPLLPLLPPPVLIPNAAEVTASEPATVGGVITAARFAKAAACRLLYIIVCVRSHVNLMWRMWCSVAC